MAHRGSRGLGIVGTFLVAAGCTAEGKGTLGRPCESTDDCNAGQYCSEVCMELPDELDDDIRTLSLAYQRDVDIVFVVDDTMTMAAAQGKLASAGAAFIERLEDPEVDANYRIAVVTTEMGHAQCSPATSPGVFVARSCRDAADEFDLGTVDPADEAFDLACANACPDGVAPTLGDWPVAGDETPRPRPWIERYEGDSNVVGSTPAQAFACFAPVGLDGCRFESPLEAMRNALERSKVSGDAQFGFVREQSTLAIAYLTDAADCSTNPAAGFDVFDPGLPEAERVFWSDPTAELATASVCWNAGVECESRPEGGSTCRATEHFASGGVAPDDADDAVLHARSSYDQFLQGIEDDKQGFGPDQQVIVHLIAGVSPDHSPNADLVYTHDDPAAVDAFGVDFGCEVPGSGLTSQRGVPPVRLLEHATTMSTRDDGRPAVSSICASDFEASLVAFADDIAETLRHGCLEKCVADVDPSTPQLDVDCTVEEQDGVSGAVSTVPPCPDGVLPEGAPTCYELRTDDERHPDCAAAGLNAQFVIHRDPMQPPSPRTEVRMPECVLSEQPELDCPDF